MDGWTSREHPRDWVLRGAIEKAVGRPVQGLSMVELVLVGT